MPCLHTKKKLFCRKRPPSQDMLLWMRFSQSGYPINEKLWFVSHKGVTLRSKLFVFHNEVTLRIDKVFRFPQWGYPAIKIFCFPQWGYPANGHSFSFLTIILPWESGNSFFFSFFFSKFVSHNEVTRWTQPFPSLSLTRERNHRDSYIHRAAVNFTVRALEWPMHQW